MNIPQPPSCPPPWASLARSVSQRGDTVVKLVDEASLCANCGQQGHYYKDCALPISSFGLVCFQLVVNFDSHSINPMFMLVQRKDSMSYVEFVRGKYQPHDKEYVTKLVETMTADEQESLRTKPFSELWHSVWGPATPRKCLATEFAVASAACAELVSGKHGYTLAGILEGDLPHLQERQWGFPKGRRNIREAEVVCAMREFMEETGINSLAVHRFPFSYCEEFLGSNGVTYRHKYYLARLVDPRGLPENGSTTESQAREINCARWMTYNEALEKLAVSEARQGVLHQALAEVKQLIGARRHGAFAQQSCAEGLR